MALGRRRHPAGRSRHCRRRTARSQVGVGRGDEHALAAADAAEVHAAHDGVIRLHLGAGEADKAARPGQRKCARLGPMVDFENDIRRADRAHRPSNEAGHHLVHISVESESASNVVDIDQNGVLLCSSKRSR
eukprot:scaffold10939_cov117-Isochrysis_galbana.AAC.2